MPNERLTPLVFFGGAALAAACILGGGTHGGFVSDAILEFVTLPILLACLFAMTRAPSLPAPARKALLCCALLAAVPLLQLVPLPPLLWTHLPGRGAIVDAYRTVSPDLPWAPLTLTPTDTMQAALSLIPAFAVFVATLMANARERRQLSLLVIALGLAEAFLGLAQIAQGPPSPLRPYAVTSNDVAVGLFANRNHLATALDGAVAFVAAWAAAAVVAALRPRRSRTIDYSPYVTLLLAGVAVAILCIGVLITRSRAGFLLMGAALASGLALAPWRQIEWRSRLSRPAVAVLAIAVIGTIVLLAQLSLLATLQRFLVETLPTDRFRLARNTFDVALTMLPFGSGVGSFVPVYALHERLADMPIQVFVNHAHNDFAETLLETGIVGPLMILFFAIWFVRTALRIWRKPYFQGHDVDRALQRAATIVPVIVAAHSFVDYPLRTGAIMALFALSCGLMLDPLYAPAEPVAPPSEPARRRHRTGALRAATKALRPL